GGRPATGAGAHRHVVVRGAGRRGHRGGGADRGAGPRVGSRAGRSGGPRAGRSADRGAGFGAGRSASGVGVDAGHGRQEYAAQPVTANVAAAGSNLGRSPVKASSGADRDTPEHVPFATNSRYSPRLVVPSRRAKVNSQSAAL